MIGGAPSEFRTPVTACSAEAVAAGATVGMSRRQIQARCPDAVIVPPDSDGDARAFEPVLAVLDRFSPIVEAAVPGKAFCDLTGLERLFGHERALAGAIRKAIREAAGVDVAVGIAGNRFCAEMAALWAAGAPAGEPGEDGGSPEAAPRAHQDQEDARRSILIVPPGQERPFLEPLPLDHLPGLPDGMLERMRFLGIRTVGHFSRLSRLGLLARYGKGAERAHEFASGRDRTPLRPRAPSLQFEERVQFEVPEVQRDRLVFALRRLLTRVETRLQREGLVCRACEVVLEHERGEPSRLPLRPVQPTASAARLVDLVRWQMERQRFRGHRSVARDGVDAIAVCVTETAAQSTMQLGLFDGGLVQGERLAIALDRLRGRLGQEAVQHASALTDASAGSRRPEEAFRFAPRGSLDQSDALDLTQPRPATSPAALRFIDPPRPIRVYVWDSALRSLYVSRYREPVLASAGPWRLVEAWWAEDRSIERDYYQVLTRSQAVYLVYQDRLANQWYVQGFFD